MEKEDEYSLLIDFEKLSREEATTIIALNKTLAKYYGSNIDAVGMFILAILANIIVGFLVPLIFIYYQNSMQKIAPWLILTGILILLMIIILLVHQLRKAREIQFQLERSVDKSLCYMYPKIIAKNGSNYKIKPPIKKLYVD